MPIDPTKLTSYGLFKRFWEDENAPGTSHRGLDELTPEGAANLADYALNHEVDGTESPADQKKIDDDEREVLKRILEDPHYGAFFELDGRVEVLKRFGIDPATVPAPAGAKRPASAGKIDIPANGSKYPIATLGHSPITSLPDAFMKEYQARKATLEAPSLKPEERSRLVLGLFKAYTDALWAHGEKPETEIVGQKLLEALEKTQSGKILGHTDFNAAGWSVAQSLVLGMDPNSFEKRFTRIGGANDGTHLAMDGGMAPAMKVMDQYRVAIGKPAAAEAFEKKSPLGWMLGEETGHTKAGNLNEKTPFATSGLNFGVLLFPKDDEVKALPVKAGFEFPIDCIDGFGNAVQAKPAWGDKIVVKDAAGKPVTVEKVINKDAAGKPESWSAIFKDQDGKELAPDAVIGLITSQNGKLKGDGLVTRSMNMWWWGFCDRNTAQKLYKAKYDLPQLDREIIKVKAGEQTLAIPMAEAQQLIDCDMPDIVTGETTSGFRFNDEPQEVRLKSGDVLQARVKGLMLEAGPGTTRLGGDKIAVHDAPKRPMLGTIEVQEGDNEANSFDVRFVDKITQNADGTVLVKMKDDYHGWPKEGAGKLLTNVPWDKAIEQEGKKVLAQTEDFAIRGGFTLELLDGTTKRFGASEVSQVSGETQKDLRLSQFMAWVSQQQGIFATDGSTGVVVSNGMRWVNRFDVVEQEGEARPEWAPKDALVGIQGDLERQDGDKILWARALYAYNKESEINTSAFDGWIQVSKDGAILNEGFTNGQPDFGWGASGKLNWSAGSSFNPYVEPELRLRLLVNGVKDQAKLEQLAAAGNLPDNWKTYLTPQD